MKTALRVLLAAASLLAMLAMSQVVLFNLRLHRSLQLQRTAAECTSLEREIEELQNETAGLLSPVRLELLGDSLGLSPMPLDRISVQDSPASREESGDAVAQLR